MAVWRYPVSLNWNVDQIKGNRWVPHETLPPKQTDKQTSKQTTQNTTINQKAKEQGQQKCTTNLRQQTTAKQKSDKKQAAKRNNKTALVTAKSMPFFFCSLFFCAAVVVYWCWGLKFLSVACIYILSKSRQLFFCLKWNEPEVKQRNQTNVLQDENNNWMY